MISLHDLHSWTTNCLFVQHFATWILYWLLITFVSSPNIIRFWNIFMSLLIATVCSFQLFHSFGYNLSSGTLYHSAHADFNGYLQIFRYFGDIKTIIPKTSISFFYERNSQYHMHQGQRDSIDVKVLACNTWNCIWFPKSHGWQTPSPTPNPHQAQSQEYRWANGIRNVRQYNTRCSNVLLQIYSPTM